MEIINDYEQLLNVFSYIRKDGKLIFFCYPDISIAYWITVILKMDIPLRVAFS